MDEAEVFTKVDTFLTFRECSKTFLWSRCRIVTNDNTCTQPKMALRRWCARGRRKDRSSRWQLRGVNAWCGTSRHESASRCCWTAARSFKNSKRRKSAGRTGSLSQLKMITNRIPARDHTMIITQRPINTSELQNSIPCHCSITVSLQLLDWGE